MKKFLLFSSCAILSGSIALAQQKKYQIPVNVGLLATNKHHKSAWGLQVGLGFQKPIGRRFDVRLDANVSYEFYRTEDVRNRLNPYIGSTQSITNEKLSLFLVNLPLTFGYTFKNTPLQPRVFAGLIPKFKIAGNYEKQNLYYRNDVLEDEYNLKANLNKKEEVVGFRALTSPVFGASITLKSGLNVGVSYQANLGNRNGFYETPEYDQCIIYGYSWNSNRFMLNLGFDLAKLY